MTFAHPCFLLLLLLLPLLAWLKGKVGFQPAFLYSSVQLVRGITGITRSRAGAILAKLRWLALALFFVALARPQIGEGETKVTASGVDIVVAIDLSGSMSSEDFELQGQRVNRLAIAKDVLQKFVADKDGTAIGSALTAALNRLREIRSKSKIVILMTDGQNNAGKVPPLTAAEAAETLAVKVYTIGVGTRGMAPMPVGRNPFTGEVVYRDEPVDIDEATLQQISGRTGGKYYRADKTETLRSIYDEIDRLEKTEVIVKKYQRYREMFPFVALPGLVLLLLEIILHHTVWRKLP
ncbi:MAG: hypothetical protein DME24_07915 [Verrucomicrobia bacterium]|nr:MAG: hypothetical protein DME24_07915 [Verrucomicrobiota bacterium]